MQTSQIILALVLALVQSSLASSWRTDAYKWFISAVGDGSSNQESATFITNQLKLHWSSVGGDSFEYMVYVNDATVKTARFSSTSSIGPDGEAIEPDVLELSDPTQKVKMLALRMPRKNVTCTASIDQVTLKSILDLSIKTANIAEPQSLLASVMSANILNFTAEAVIVSTEGVKYGFAESTGDQQCFFSYSFGTTWAVKYFGDFNKALKDDDPSYIALTSLLQSLTQSSTVTNDALATKVQNDLTDLSADHFWVTMVKDFKSGSITWSHFVNEKEAFFNKTFTVDNFCGKSVVIAGGKVPASSDANTCIPGYIQDFYFDAITSSAIAQSGATPQNVTDKLSAESEIIGLKPLTILATNDKLAGVKYYLDGDCTYYNKALASGAWQVLYYGVPTPPEKNMKASKPLRPFNNL